MDKVIISSLTDDDLERLSSLATYLLKLKSKKETFSVSNVSCSKYEEYFVSTEPCILTIEELKLLKKLKHLHILSYD